MHLALYLNVWMALSISATCSLALEVFTMPFLICQSMVLQNSISIWTFYTIMLLMEYIFITRFKTTFSEIPTQIWKKLTRDQNARSFARQREANPCYHDVSHIIRFAYIFQLKIIPVTSSDIVIPSLALFGFVLPYTFIRFVLTC